MELFLLVLLGGLVALDSTSFGQFMLSRPIVAGALAGAVLGDPVTGLLVGAFLDLFILPVLPVGGARFHEGGPSAVVASAVAVSGGGPGAWVLGLVAGLLWSVLGGMSVRGLRRWNGRLAPDPNDRSLTEARIVRRHLLAMGADFTRGIGLTAIGFAVWLPWAVHAAAAWPLGAMETVALAALASAVPLGMLLSILGPSSRRLGYLVLGILLGLLPTLFP